MNYRFKPALLGLLALIASGYCQAALDDVAKAVADGDFRAALEALASVPEDERESIEGQLLQATALAGNGELDAAEERYRAIIKEAPNLPEAYNNLAVIYARQGKLDDARKLLEQAMRTNTSYATVYDNLSGVYLEMSRSSYAKALPLGQRRKGPHLQALYSVSPAGVVSKPPLVVASAASVAPVEIPPDDAIAEPPVVKEVSAATVASLESETVAEAPVTEPPVVEAEPEPAVAVSEPETVAEAPVTESPVVEAEPEPAVAVPEPETVAEAPVTEPPAVEVSPEPPVVSAESLAQAETDAEAPAVEATLEPMSTAAASAPATAVAQVVPPRQVLIAMLERWAGDWAGQNVEGYLGAYDVDFQPGHGLSLAQWQAQRRKRLARPAYIEVKLSDFTVNLKGDSYAVVDVVQEYRSDHYRDRTRKRFRLIKRPEGWKIASEKTIEVL